MTARPVHGRKRAYRARLHAGDFFVIRHLQRWLRRVIPATVHPGTSVGDLGCGERPWQETLAARGATATGIDVVQNASGTVDVVAPITNVPLPDESFDVILCTEVLEHVSDTRAAVREMHRLLRPGGRLVVTTPFCYPLHEEPYDYVRLTPHQLRMLASEHGFEVLELETTGNELEVMATVWCNLWSRGVPKRFGVVRKLWLAAMRVPINIVVLGLSTAIGSALPVRAFLSCVAVLRKPERR